MKLHISEIIDVNERNIFLDLKKCYKCPTIMVCVTYCTDVFIGAIRVNQTIP